MYKQAKKLLALLLFIAVLMTSMPVIGFALTAEEALDYLSYEINDGEVTITDCDESISGDLTIPSTIEGYPVTGIGDYAFYYRSSLTSITIPDSVTSIGAWTFEGCSSLTSVTIPDSVTSIGDCAFENCTNLSDIRIPNSLNELGGDLLNNTAYYNDSSNWKSGMLYIDNWLINTIPEEILNTCIIKSTTKGIAGNAFSNCVNLSSLIIPDSVVHIGKEIFLDCYKLEEIDIDENNPKYDSRNNCNAIIETDSNTLVIGCKKSSIPYGVEKIGDNAFSNCSDFSEIEIPCSVKEIGKGAFRSTDIESIKIPDGVTRIEEYTFGGCEFLKDITIPASINSISRNGTFECVYLSNVFFDGSVDDWCNINYLGDGYSHITTENLYIQGELPTEITLSKSVTSIPEYAFYNCKTLNSITFSDSVERIGYGAFRNCSGLKDLFIPENITYIGYNSFAGCSGLQSITVSEKNEIYDSRDNCNALIESNSNAILLGCKNTKIPNTVKIIDSYAFEDCTDLKEIIIPNGVEEILWSAFYGCTKLTSISLPESVNNIYTSAFSECTNLKSITVDQNNQYFSNDKHGILYNKDFSNLLICPPTLNIEFTIPDSVVAIDDSAFDRCYNVTVNVTSGTTELKSYGMYSHIRHAKIFIPETVLKIEDGSFAEYFDHLIAPIIVDDNNPNYSSDEYGNLYNKDKSEVIGVQDKYYSNPNNWENGVLYLNGDYLYEGAQQNLGKSGPPEGIEVTGDYKIKEGTKCIRYRAFEYCWGLRSVYIPYSLKSISSGAFIDTGLNSVTISEGVEEIESRAFYFCKNLKSIIIPKSVNKIGEQALGYYGYMNMVGSKVDGFKIYCYSGTAGEKYAIDNGFDYELLDDSESATVIDEKSGVELEIPSGTFDGDVTLKVKEVLSGSSFDIIGKVNGKSKTKVFTIETYVDGQSVQPNGDVTVRILVPDGFNAEKCKLYYLNTSSKNPEEIAFKVEDGYIVFTTNHFSDWAIVQLAGEPIVSVDDIEMNYKKSATLNPVIDVDEGVNYTVEYSSSNPSVAKVDENGNVYGAKKGSAEITVTVTDEYGNSVSDTCNVKVNYSFGQWLIVILLFGWIWY